MTSLVNEIIEAHGGLEVWRQYEQLSAQLTQGGALWHLKGQAGVLDNAKVTVGLKEHHSLTALSSLHRRRQYLKKLQ